MHNFTKRVSEHVFGLFEAGLLPCRKSLESLPVHLEDSLELWSVHL